MFKDACKEMDIPFIEVSATNMSTKHSPTPWKTGMTGSKMQSYGQPFAILQRDEENLIAGVFGDVRGGREVSEANAEHICHCVNTHAQLVEALEHLASVNISTTDHQKNTMAFLAARDFAAAALTAAKSGK